MNKPELVGLKKFFIGSAWSLNTFKRTYKDLWTIENDSKRGSKDSVLSLHLHHHNCYHDAI